MTDRFFSCRKISMRKMTDCYFRITRVCASLNDQYGVLFSRIRWAYWSLCFFFLFSQCGRMWLCVLVCWATRSRRRRVRRSCRVGSHPIYALFLDSYCQVAARRRRAHRTASRTIAFSFAQQRHSLAHFVVYFSQIYYFSAIFQKKMFSLVDHFLAGFFSSSPLRINFPFFQSLFSVSRLTFLVFLFQFFF